MSYNPPPLPPSGDQPSYQQQPAYGGPPPPRRSSPWPWIIGFGCGVPLLCIVGCMGFVGYVGKKVMDDPSFQKAIKEGANGSSSAKNTAMEKVSFDPKSFTTSRDALGLLHVKGTIKNKTDEAIPYLEVRFSCLDKTGSQVDSAMSNVTELQPKAAWKFDVACTNAATVKAKLSTVTNTVLAN